MKIQIKRVDKELPLPKYESGTGYTTGIACFDFVCRETVTIGPREIKLVPSNTIIKLPDGYALLITCRSNTPIHKGITLAQGMGVVDPYFCGDKDEIQLQIYNMSDKPYTVERGDKIAQGMITKYEVAEWQEVDEMKDKGDGGYWAVRDNITQKKLETT